MKRNLKNQYHDVESYFSAQASSNQKAWSIIHDFYHIILTFMENKKITKADLSRKLGISRASISQMFNKTPNITIRKMVEIADAVGIELKISTHDQEDTRNYKIIKQFVFVPINIPYPWQELNVDQANYSYKNMSIITDNRLATNFCDDAIPC